MRTKTFTDPNYAGYKESLDFVKKHGDTMNFSTPAERRDYEKAVKANPQNVMGVPAFFPAVKVQNSFSDIHGSRECSTPNCGGCCIARDGYKCPRCGAQN